MPDTFSAPEVRWQKLKRVGSFVSSDDWIVIGWVFAIRVLLFIFGSKSYQILENKRTPGWFGWIDPWKRWDADKYLKVAQFGYESTGPWKAWHYPLYSWCVRIVAWTNGNYVVSGLLVSLLA